MAAPTHLHGAIDVATDALSGILATIEGVHNAIARKPFAALRVAPAVGEVSEIVRDVHDGITDLVYASLGAAIAIGGGAARLAADVAAPQAREPQTGSPADLAVAALNGYLGERLERSANPLAIEMTLRHAGQAVRLERPALKAAFPNASPRVAVFVHGLACNESLWQRDAERHYGNPDTTYGSRLQADLGHTAVYVRYNTGLHISDNGRRLATLLEHLVTEWPVPVTELVLIGHSMGGLVIRSATHAGQEQDHDWIRPLRHVVYLAAPHLGAPLEKAVNVAAWLLGQFDVTRPLAALVNVRSSGIKDLRFGALRDDDWRDADADDLLANRASDVALLETAAHYFITATVTQDPRHPWGMTIGDLLVRQASAAGRGRLRHSQFALHDSRHFGAMTHLGLLNHPDVYDQLLHWLRPPPALA